MKANTVMLTAVIMSLIFTGINVSSAEEKKTGNSIFDYKEELSLTDKQEKNLRKIVTELQTNLTEKQNKLKDLQTELNKMLTDRANLYKVKFKLYVAAKVQADMTYENIAGTRAIEKELDEAQMSKWRGMQAAYAENLKQAQAVAANKNGGTK